MDDICENIKSRLSFNSAHNPKFDNNKFTKLRTFEHALKREFRNQLKMELGTNSHEKDIYRVVPFEGKKEEWRKWSRKFLAHARYKGYRKLLEGKETYPEPDDEGCSKTSNSQVC